MERLKESDVTNIIKQINERSDRCLVEIKHLVKQQEGETISVYDGKNDNMYAVIGYTDGETREEQIMRLSIGDCGQLVLDTDTGNTVNESRVCYRSAVWPEMLSVLLEYINKPTDTKHFLSKEDGYNANKDFLEENGFSIGENEKWEGVDIEIESYTNGGGDMIITLDNLTRENMVNYLQDFDVYEETNLWFPEGKPGRGVPFDNYKDLWEDIENWRRWALSIAKEMPY